jgi:hypothetical protein
VDLVTHDAAGEVLYSNCERRVRQLHPLLSPPACPSPALKISDSGEQLALAIAPSAGKGFLNPKVVESQQDLNKNAFLHDIGLKKQHPIDAQSESPNFL